VIARKPSNSVSQHKRHGVWVPAFAGTTIIHPNYETTKLICPTGKSVNWLSSPICKNISLLRRPKSAH
jgi:hypothetical protein